MLQWMGGSRRKVTMSGKSTHKRQKQYFEQRKRQQLQHTAGLESYADERRSCIENSRSLDILSLVNVSTAAQGHKTSCINEAGDESEDYGFTLDHQYTQPYQAILDDEAFSVDQAEINEERAPPSYGTDAKYSEKVSFHLPDYNEDLVGSGNKKSDPFELSASRSEISVMDLLCDNGASNNAEKYPVHVQEPHVAFSITGLGKVEPETPPHSPKIPGRSAPTGFSQRQKAKIQPITYKHMDYYGFNDLRPRVDVAMQEDDFSPYESPKKQTFLSKDMMNIIDDPNLMFSNRRCSSPFNWDGSNSQVAFENDELVYNIRDSSRNNWDGPSFLDDSIDEMGVRETFCKNWADQRSVPYENYLHNNDLWKQGVSFDGGNLQKKRFSAERIENIDLRGASPIQQNVSASPFPHMKHQTKGGPYEIPNTRYSSIRIDDDDVRDAVNHFVKEENGESLSLLSEESCTSTAVRGDAIRKS